MTAILRVFCTLARLRTRAKENARSFRSRCRTDVRAVRVAFNTLNVCSISIPDLAAGLLCYLNLDLYAERNREREREGWEGGRERASEI